VKIDIYMMDIGLDISFGLVLYWALIASPLFLSKCSVGFGYHGFVLGKTDPDRINPPENCLASPVTRLTHPNPPD
jgi:hypothetical protein